MLAANINPLNQWPKVRRVRPDMLRVKGRCITSGQWLALRLFATLATVFLIFSVLAAALLPWVLGLQIYLAQGNPINVWIELLVDFRHWLRVVLIRYYPTVGKAIWYNGSSPIDWHLLGVVIVLRWFKRVIVYGIAAGLGAALSPLVSKRFKVSFTRDTVIIHRWFRSWKLSRSLSVGGGVEFRTGNPNHHSGLLRVLMRLRLLQPSMDNELVPVIVVAGRRPYKITGPRKQSDAERIIQSMDLAMKYSR